MTPQPSTDHECSPAQDCPDETRTPALLTITDAVQVLRLSRSVIYEQIKAGRLRTVRQGRATRITTAAIGEYIRLLETEGDARSIKNS